MRKVNADRRQMRTRGSTTVKSGAHKQVDPFNRKMRRQMQQQGVEGMEEIPANRIIIEQDDGDLVIESPQVIKMNQGGMTVYQVIGEGVPVEKGSYSQNDLDAEIIDESEDEDEIIEDQEPIKIEVTEQDVQLVAMQTGVSPEVARNALEEANGDLAGAIMNIKSRGL